MQFFFLALSISYERKWAVIIIFCANIQQNSLVRCVQFSGNSPSELTNIDGKACNNNPEAVNKLALSAHLGHSCETGVK